MFDCYDVGMKMCCEVLGDVYVDCVEVVKMDFDLQFQILIIEGVWGNVWMFDVISCCEWLMLMLVLLVVFGNFEEILMYICVIVWIGVFKQDVFEVFQYVVIYVGVFCVNYVIKLVKQIYVEMEVVNE